MLDENDTSQSESINMEVLITEIEARPEIWDPSCEVYKDRMKKKDAWDEICSLLHPNFFSLTSAQQILFGKNIQKKWKNVRDAYAKNKRCGKGRLRQAGKKKRNYIYEKELQFLDKVKTEFNQISNICTTSIESTNDEIENTEEEKYFGVRSVSEQQNVKGMASGSIRRKNSVEANNLQNLEIRLKETQTEADEHEYFFKSLLPTIRKFDEDQVLEFRAAVINLVQNIKRHKPAHVHS